MDELLLSSIYDENYLLSKVTRGHCKAELLQSVEKSWVESQVTI